MLKKILALVAMLYAAACFAAVDVNKATAAELDSVKGIGPAISGKIMDERKKGNFKDWNDFITRVKGVGEASAAKLSTAGLTVNGSAFGTAKAAPATPATKASPAAPATPATKAVPAAPVMPATIAAPTTKAAPAAPAAKAAASVAKPADKASAPKASASAAKK